METQERPTGTAYRVSAASLGLALSVVVLLAMIAGCATLEARNRLQEYDDYFSPLIGKATHADIARKFGDPIRKDKIGGTELWYYHISRERGSQTKGGFEGGYAVGADQEDYDDLTIEFDAKGRLKSWRGYIQR